ncbi:Met-10+ like-protein-domain-containing protein, partial [Baffinella frigidus]
QVLLDKNAHILTVVNKVGNIQSEFRVFEMEVLAGENRLETEVKQRGISFLLDYSKAYWNSRLEGEHERLVASLLPSDEVWDMFAGIGLPQPSTLNQGCAVHANDLNPASSHYCAVNLERNLNARAEVHNLDAREFIQNRIAAHQASGGSDGAVRIVMNLPASAPEFMDAFQGVMEVPPYTLHPTPYTLHPTPYTLHPTPCTLHTTPYTLHPEP